MARSVYNVIPGKLKGCFFISGCQKMFCLWRSNLLIIFHRTVSKMALNGVEPRNHSYLRSAILSVLIHGLEYTMISYIAKKKKIWIKKNSKFLHTKEVDSIQDSAST